MRNSARVGALTVGLVLIACVSGYSSKDNSTAFPRTVMSQPRATGTPVGPSEGYPTVSFDHAGKPTVTIPDIKPSGSTEFTDLKRGDGHLVQGGDTITMQYQGVIWRTGKVFDQTWGKGATSFPLRKTILGLQKALIGQRVGSQILVIVPPVDGYGRKGRPEVDVRATDTLVFVIDLLKTTHQS